MLIKGSGTTFSSRISILRPVYGLKVAGSASLKISKSEISVFNGPSSFFTATTTTCARSSSSKNAAPKGNPVPAKRSQVRSSFLASVNVNFKRSTHSSLNHSTDSMPISYVLDGKEIGLISTPPIPASFKSLSSLASSDFSILLPFHHHLTKGR